MSVYNFTDIYSKEITLMNDDFDTLVISNILDTSDLELNTEHYNYNLDYLRKDLLYTQISFLDDLIDTRMDKQNKIELTSLDRSGSSNSVLMSGTTTPIWQKLGKNIEGTLRITNVLDDAISYSGGNLISTNMNVINNLNIINYSVIPNDNNYNNFITKTTLQGSGESNWSKLIASTSEVISNTDYIHEKSNMSSKNITLLTRNKELENSFFIVDSKGNYSNATVNSRTELIKTNDVINSTSSSSKSCCVIDEDGKAYMWGDVKTTDILPPQNVGRFRTVNAGYYGHIGVTDEKKVYVFGEGTTSFLNIKKNLPTSNIYLDADLGFNYALLLKTDGTLQHIGATTYMSQALIPTLPAGVTIKKMVAAYRTGHILGSDKKIYSFGATESYKIILDTPTTNNIRDFDIYQYTGVYVTEDNVVGTWGGTWTYPLPDFQGKTITKVKSGKYLMFAFASDGTVFAWGYSTLVTNFKNIVGGVSDISSGDQYFATYITYDGTVGVIFSGSITSAPYAQISIKQNVKGIMAGSYLAGYEYNLNLDNILEAGFMKIVSSNVYFNDTDISPTTKDKFTKLEKDSIVVLSSGNIQVKYKPKEVNTNRLTFLYENMNKGEVLNSLTIDLEKIKIGE